MEEDRMKLSHVLFGSVLAAFICLTGCDNTIHGFGQDMKQAGQKIEKSTSSSSAGTTSTGKSS